MQADNKSGYANIERAGVAYTLDDETDLQDGDFIETLAVSSVDLNFKDAGKVAMNCARSSPLGSTATAQLTSMSRPETFSWRATRSIW